VARSLGALNRYRPGGVAIGLGSSLSTIPAPGSGIVRGNVTEKRPAGQALLDNLRLERFGELGAR